VKQLFTLLESSTFLQFPDLYKSLGIQETRFQSTRQFNKAIVRTAPDIMLAEFIYGFGNNYAGINISNLDVSLRALQRYAPHTKIILLADKLEHSHISKLEELFRIDASLTLPVSAKDIETAIKELDI